MSETDSSISSVKSLNHEEKEIPKKSGHRFKKIGSGSYSTVFKTYDKYSRCHIAVKVSNVLNSNKLEKEYSILSTINSEHVIEVNSFKRKQNSSYMYMELMRYSLEALLITGRKSNTRLKDNVIKCIIFSILSGLRDIHKLDIVHCDIKPGNILFNNTDIKLCDFGLAQYKGSSYDGETVSMWYKTLENVYGSRGFDTSLDIWCAGCIFFEMLTNTVLFPSKDPWQQAQFIFSRLGYPSNEEYAYMEETFTPGSLRKSVEKDFPAVVSKPYQNEITDTVALDLLGKMICYNGNKRLTAVQALEHPYFKEFMED